MRINDRGPYVVGRDMDLSLAAFTAIADRGKGKIPATFERMGDATLAGQCTDHRFQRRITRAVRLEPGIPHYFPLGKQLNLLANDYFVIRSLVYPDGNVGVSEQWISPKEGFSLTPSVTGNFLFILGDAHGSRREMGMEVVDCGGE